MTDQAFSRRFNSASTAARMKSVRSSPARKTAAMRAKVPALKRACMFSDQSGGRPMRAGLSGMTFCAKPASFLISPIAPVSHITYISRIRNGDKAMFKVHYTTQDRRSGSQRFATEAGAHDFERYLDLIGASYEREIL